MYCMYICMHVGMLLTQAGINTKLHLFIYDTDTVYLSMNG